ncbi:MAG: flagellar hook-length control protein FliK, partial [Burkholderiaceae bacterium]|nr:flagellar hook-length control protein FliK [Burkholderiaceae bacterium]
VAANAAAAQLAAASAGADAPPSAAAGPDTTSALATATATTGAAQPTEGKADASSAQDFNATLAARQAANTSADASADTGGGVKVQADLRQPVGAERVQENRAPALRGVDANAAASAPAPVAQAQLAASKGAESVNANQLPARVGTTAWDQQLGQKVVWMVAGGEQSASLTLNPPDLGPMQVVLNISNDQASASFTAAQPEVREALEAALPRLREMMSEAGIELGSATVSADTAGQQQAFEQARAAQEGHGGRGGRGQGGNGGGQGDANGGNDTTAAPRRRVLGAVDTFA